MLFERLVLTLNALVIGLIGIAYLIDPNLLLSNYGLLVDTPAMDNMLRSTYGGLFLAIAGIFGVGAARESSRRGALTLLALFMGGLAFGRFASIAFVGSPGMSINTLLAYEISVSILALFLLRRTTRSQNH